MNGFDNRTAIFLAAVCSQTYAQWNDPDGVFAIPRSYEPVGEILAASLLGVPEKFGFVMQSDTHAVVAFRGTSSTSDWLSDALVSQVEFGKNAGMTHRGFTGIYNSAREEILACLGRISPDKTLYVTGHSLGGALATLCAYDAASVTKFSLPVVYTFAAPRVGDPAFAEAYGSKIASCFRVYNEVDVVPHLPPPTLTLPKTGRTFDYKHVRHGEQLVFHKGSVAGNHAMGNYYRVLAARDPLFARRLSELNPGFCPDLT